MTERKWLVCVSARFLFLVAQWAAILKAISWAQIIFCLKNMAWKMNWLYSKTLGSIGSCCIDTLPWPFHSFFQRNLLALPGEPGNPLESSATESGKQSRSCLSASPVVSPNMWVCLHVCVRTVCVLFWFVFVFRCEFMLSVCYMCLCVWLYLLFINICVCVYMWLHALWYVYMCI